MGWLLKLITGNPVTLVYLTGGIFLAGIVAGAGPAWKIQGWRLEAVTARFDQFKAQTKAEGQAAQDKADLQAKQDKQRAKETDDEAKKRYTSLDAQYAQYRMRQQSANSATSRIVPQASADPGSGGKLCYSRNALDSEIKSSIGRLRDGIADDSEPYDKAVIMAMLCKTWAAGR